MIPWYMMSCLWEEEREPEFFSGVFATYIGGLLGCTTMGKWSRRRTTGQREEEENKKFEVSKANIAITHLYDEWAKKMKSGDGKPALPTWIQAGIVQVVQ